MRRGKGAPAHAAKRVRACFLARDFIAPAMYLLGEEAPCFLGEATPC
jgi:hypothetical protein